MSRRCRAQQQQQRHDLEPLQRTAGAKRGLGLLFVEGGRGRRRRSSAAACLFPETNMHEEIAARQASEPHCRHQRARLVAQVVPSLLSFFRLCGGAGPLALAVS